MKQTYRVDKGGNLTQLLNGINAPKLLLLMSNERQFEQHVKELDERFPGVPSIGCVGGSYGGSVVVADNGVAVIAMEGNLTVVTNVLEQKNISLVGGTGGAGKVSVNGKIYTDADAYALIRNNDGKIKVYKENIYKQVPGCRFIASQTDRSKYLLGQLNGQPAKKVYQDILHISDKEIGAQTFKNPLGKMNGQNICIISIKEIVGNQLACYRQVNDSDVLTLLEVQDIPQVVDETIQKIKKDFQHISAVFSVNCCFRYALFTQEHYNQQFVNQTMTCVVFE